jgi:hypothetical protein
VLIVDHWVDTDGTEYALAQLDMDTFKNNLDKMKELNAKVRDTARDVSWRGRGLTQQLV